ncbi:DUF2326 domain-containing protein [Candidatus Nitrospira salsa]
MLLELRCDKFREKKVSFHGGLNVVLGDNVATNSIGKSTLLMIVDYVFGGDSFLEHNSDVIEELGHHDYLFKFMFESKHYCFKRGTFKPALVFKCNEAFEEDEPITIDEYKAFLKKAYVLEDFDLTFRSFVSLFSRVWGKENLDVNQPLHSFKKQRSSDCIENILKIYGKYETIRILSDSYKNISEEKLTIGKAFKQHLIPKVSKQQYKENIQKLHGIDQEIEDIKANLKRYAGNIREIANREILELKIKKDKLLSEKFRVESRLIRVRDDLSKNKHVKSKTFTKLMQFFPDINVARVSEVEDFHSKISNILKNELRESENELSETLESINSEIHDIDFHISSTLSNVENPSAIIDRVHDLASNHASTSSEIQYFETDERVKSEHKESKNALTIEKLRVLKLVEDVINNKTRKYVSMIYSEDRRSPTISLRQNSYTFKAIEDTGTGKAYSNLILLDLAILQDTKLPFVIHDSVLFKNIENEAVAKLVNLYESIGKQSFIAIDEVNKYGTKAAKKLLKQKAIQVTNSEVLYIKDWRK